MAYTAWSVVAFETPTASKWNQLGENDASFNDGTGIGDGTINSRQLSSDILAGWLSVSETWSYATTNTVTVSGDKRTKYAVGDRVKLTQSSTVKYFTIVAINYSAPNTTLSLYAGVDNTVANEAISSIFYSKSRNPVGYPEYHSVSPTPVMDSGSRNSVSDEFRIRIDGKYCEMFYKCAWTQASSNAKYLRIPWPNGLINPASVNDPAAGSARIGSGSNDYSAGITQDGTWLYITNYVWSTSSFVNGQACSVYGQAKWRYAS